MDTKLKKFKYTYFTKIICVILSALCLFSAANSAYIFLRSISLYGFDSFISNENKPFTECYGFVNKFVDNITDVAVISDYDESNISKQLESQATETVNEAVDAYLDEKASIIEAELEYAVNNYDDSYFMYEYSADMVEVPTTMADNNGEVATGYSYSVQTTIPEQTTIPRNIEAAQKVLETASGRDFLNYEALVRSSAFKKNFSYETNVAINDGNRINDNYVYFTVDTMTYSESQIKSEFMYQYNDLKNSIVSNYSFQNYDSKWKLDEVNNFHYYVKNKNDVVFSNNKTDKEINSTNIKNNDIYIIYDGKDVTVHGFTDSDTISSIKETLKQETIKECYIYFDCDNLENDDLYSDMYDTYKFLESKPTANALILITAVMLILSFLFLITLLCLCGNTNSSDSHTIAFTDKIPTDIHLIISLALTSGLLFLCFLIFDSINYYTRQYLYTQLIGCGLSALCVCIWLVFTEWLTSVVRIKKAGLKFFKKTVTYMFLRFLIKKIRKTNRAIKEFFSYKPNKMRKQTILLLVGYVFVNLILTLLSIIAGYYSVVGIVFFILAIIFNVFVAIFLLKYVKIFDNIITATSEHKNIVFDNENIPTELKLLADNLTNSNQQLKTAIEKAVKDELMKTELITNVSHDLKTPLTSLITYSDLLGKCNITDENAIKYKNVIHQQSIKLKRLIEDLIEASKVSTGNVTINKAVLNLSELSIQAISEFSSDIEKNGNTIIFNEPDEAPKVFADSSKTYRIISNLLSNTKKYSAPDTRIYISVYSDGINGYFEIKNISCEPLNISPEELTERFVRGDKSRSKEGNGLGLSIAKELCNLQNGELKIIIDGDLFKVIVKLPCKKDEDTINTEDLTKEDTI